MVKTKIAVLVSGGGTNLQALLDAQAAGRIPHGEIALVVSNRADAYALERAKKAGVPAVALGSEETCTAVRPGAAGAASSLTSMASMRAWSCWLPMLAMRS